MAVISYKCPNCDGPLTWNGTKKKFTCDYCSSAFTEEELEKLNPTQQQAETVTAENAGMYGVDPSELAGAAEASGQEAAHAGTGANTQGKKPVSMKPGSFKIYSCPSCGAQIASDPTTAATTCFYCQNPVVIMDKFEGDFNPDYILPFEIDKKKAQEIFKAWLSQHKYVPKAFYKDRIDEIAGVYFPYWVYNSNVFTHVTGEGHKIRTYQVGDTKHIETSVYDLSETGNVEVKDIVCIALKKASKVLCESVMPFKMENAEAFQPAYLQGYSAEMRDIERAEIENDVKQEAKSYTQTKVRSNLAGGYDKTVVNDFKMQVTDESFHYALLPVWTLTYKGRDGKIYYFSINGQTGKTCGELPVDQNKLLRLFLSVALPLFAALLALFWFIL